MTAAVIIAVLPVLLAVYAYAAYPALLALVARARTSPVMEREFRWPHVSITVPCYNEAARIRQTLSDVLAFDIPRDRLQIVVISDGSTDETDEIVRSFADHGVELLRLPERRGKSAAENAAAAVVTGEIVVNIDAATRVPQESLRALISALMDPKVGLATGRNVSVAPTATTDESIGEGRYVAYDMWVRELETSVHSVVGASGCFYAVRRELYDRQFPEDADRDFASALVAWEYGFRSVAVSSAVCYVTRASSLDTEFRRKVRTMSRGIRTLRYNKRLLNPAKNATLAWMLFSHKLARWLVYPLLPFAILAVAFASWKSPAWRPVLAVALFGLAIAIIGQSRRCRNVLPSVFRLTAFAAVAATAGVAAWWQALFGPPMASWEPTRRETLT